MDIDNLINAGLAAFDAVVASMPGFRPRPGQREMAAEVARAFATGQLGDTGDTPGRAIAVVQAGTGVGKSAAYTAVGVAIARARKTRLLLTTATTTLQSQLAEKDLPMLASTMKEPFSFAIAKGRSRYVCRVKLARQLGVDGGLGDDLDFDDEEVRSPSGADAKATTGIEQKVAFYRSLSDALTSGWAGDRDSLSEQPLPALWQSVAADRYTCTVKACPQFHACSFYQARRELARVDVIVANHDLVLASIGARTLPPLNDCLIAFDEGHHLGKVATEQFACKMDLTRLRWLDKLPKVMRKVADEVKYSMSLDADRACRDLKTALTGVGSIVWDGFSSQMRSSDGVYRFPGGKLPTPLEEPIRFIREHSTHIHDELHAVVLALRERIKDLPELNARWTQLLSAIGGFVPRVDGVRSTSLLLATEGEEAGKLAKWVSADIGTGYVGLTLNSCPILPGELLATNLWSGVRAAVVTSATLTSCGKFDYFMAEAGLDQDPGAWTKAVASPFDFPKQGEIVVRRTRANPKALSQFNEEVSQLLAADLEQVRAGALALFTSRAHMMATLDAVSPALRDRILVQGTRSRGLLLQEHRRRVETGEPSILFGLQSFGEGLDLPGSLCGELFISKLPFSPPTNPVDEARAEFVEANGGSAFDELVVPATGLRLLQWVGRGVRTETDWARITCFDCRLTQRDFGRRMLRGLPPFPVREVAVGQISSSALI